MRAITNTTGKPRKSLLNLLRSMINGLVPRSVLRKLFVSSRIDILIEIMAHNFTQEHLFNNPKYHETNRLTRFEHRAFSQGGEDGIIEEILKRIGTNNNYVVEFGAGTGLQNCSAYLLNKGWSGLWIETDQTMFDRIRRVYSQLIDNGVLSVDREFVTAETIETIFEAQKVPDEFDMLSIDIDGNDYWVWKAINRFRPRMVVIEYNAVFSPSTQWVQKYNPSHIWDGTSASGASLKSLEILGSTKGYRLVGCNFAGVNAFFVREDLIEDKFCEPFTAENHYEPARHFLYGLNRQRTGFREHLNI